MVRSLSTVFFFATRLLSILYITLSAYALLAISMYAAGIQMAPVAVSPEGFRIFYPFTTAPLLLGEFNSPYIVAMVGGFALYGIFFWLLSNVFATFRKERLFTDTGVKRLSRFYIFSIFTPPVVLVLMALFEQSEPAAQMIGFLHVIIGIFAYFMAAIFRQGLELQVQQDFTI
jgi:hypothetical protein